MRQFDIMELTDRTLAIVLQSELLDAAATQVIAPLVPSGTFVPLRRVNAIARHEDRGYIVVMEKLSAVFRRDIVRVVGSARHLEWELRRALDMIFVGA